MSIEDKLYQDGFRDGSASCYKALAASGDRVAELAALSDDHKCTYTSILVDRCVNPKCSKTRGGVKITDESLMEHGVDRCWCGKIVDTPTEKMSAHERT